MDASSLNDRRVVARQLGREPRGRFVVSVRCGYGFPQVIRVHPIVDDRPFPTLFWLTCPLLCRAIDRLEAAGWVKRWEDRLAGDPDLQEAMNEAHRRAIRQRDALLDEAERHRLERSGRSAALSERGIGGLADWRTLKCLHLHAAHALADENPMGDLVLQTVGLRQCTTEEVICSAYE